jgi:hypothetical protein
MVTIYKDIEVEIDLDDFSDKDLIDELESRGTYTPFMGDADVLIDKIFHARRQGKPYDHLLDQYLYEVTGRVV